MAKRIQIEETPGYQYFVIGIVSDEHIWKLCWEINQNLQLKLKKKDIDLLSPAEKKDNTPISYPLFETQDLQKADWLEAYYEDVESHFAIEYALFRNEPSISPKKVHPFRYFLLIRADRDMKFKVESVRKMLANAHSIRSTADLSMVKNINKIIL